MSEKDKNEEIIELEKPVEQIDVKGSKDIVHMINSFSNMGFNAKRLADACKIYENMIKEKECVKYFALAGAMVPVGLQKVVYDFIDAGFIDVLVTTGATLTHDVCEAIGEHHLQGYSANDVASDAELFEKRINRIYDVFMPNEIYEHMEKWLESFDIDTKGSVHEVLWELGKQLPEDSKSILRICADKEIPIYCPAFTDSGLAMQLSFKYPTMNLNHFEDLQHSINKAWDTECAGIFVVGGGVPKNFIFQSMQFSPNSAKYVVQITTDVQVSAGGLSSASLNEAVSWGKINEQGFTSQVHLDASVALPLILSYLKYQFKIE